MMRMVNAVKTLLSSKMRQCWRKLRGWYKSMP